MLERRSLIGVIGAGTMGSGVALVAALAGHEVRLWDKDPQALVRAANSLNMYLERQVEKGKIDKSAAAAVSARVKQIPAVSELAGCLLVIEAVAEDLGVKRALFCELEAVVSDGSILASNTSSLSVTALGAALKKPGRFIGLHFFNPVHAMALVEVIPGFKSDQNSVESARALVESWGKSAVLAKDTPGFIVNRIARPFYGEALRMYEQGVADMAGIDWAVKKFGGFRMGPFELMDLIGNDINFQVTQTVFQELFFESRYRPCLTQKRMVEAGLLGRKSGRGYYDYTEGAHKPEPRCDDELGRRIFLRIVAMLINEAIDASFLGLASRTDLERAVTLGLNYPRGLLGWADELGLANVLAWLEELQIEFGEERYRPSPLLRKMVREKQRFFE